MLKSRIIKYLLIVKILCFALLGNIFGAQAIPSLFEITQPNGDKFRAYLRGDEYFSWWESEKGTVLVRNLVSGYFEYAKISMTENKEGVFSSGVIFTTKDESSFSGAFFTKPKKLNIYKIWRKKREDARTRLLQILEKQKQPKN